MNGGYIELVNLVFMGLKPIDNWGGHYLVVMFSGKIEILDSEEPGLSPRF